MKKRKQEKEAGMGLITRDRTMCCQVKNKKTTGAVRDEGRLGV